MTIRIPEELLVAAAKEEAKKSEWFSFPGTELDESMKDQHADALVEQINEYKLRATFMPKDVFSFYGAENFLIVTVNRLKPQQFFLAVSEEAFKKEFFA